MGSLVGSSDGYMKGLYSTVRLHSKGNENERRENNTGIESLPVGSLFQLLPFPRTTGGTKSQLRLIFLRR